MCVTGAIRQVTIVVTLLDERTSSTAQVTAVKYGHIRHGCMGKVALPRSADK